MPGFPYKILFVCIHNSARSQMAEAFLNKYANGELTAESAGIEAGKMNLNVVKVMQEAGIDLSRKGTQQVSEILRKGDRYDAVITVCDAANAERCPAFPGVVKRIAWSFEDPSSAEGTPKEILAKTRMVRNEIDRKIKEFVADFRGASQLM